MSRDPFRLPLRELPTTPKSTLHSLDFDQSNIDPRFNKDDLGEDKIELSPKVLTGVVLVVLALLSVRLINLQILSHQKLRSIQPALFGTK